MIYHINMDSLDNTNDKIKTIINKTKQNIKKGMQIGILGTALATGVIFTSCELPTGEITSKPSTVMPTGPEDPYDKTINWDYVFHNFLGEEPNITEMTANQDVDKYLNMGKEYLQNLFDNFQSSIEDRPTIKKYYANFTYENASYYPEENSHHSKNKGKEIDSAINRLSYVCERYLENIAQNLYYEKDREAFYLCYATLANEAYKEGYSGNFDQDSKAKYNQKRDLIQAEMKEHQDLGTLNYDHDVDDRHCKQITDHMNILLRRAAQFMYSQTKGEIKVSDLLQIVNISLNVHSLEAMHDYTQNDLHHYSCNLQIKTTDIIHNTTSTAQYSQNTDEMCR